MTKFIVEISAKGKFEIYSEHPNPSVETIEEEMKKRGINTEQFDIEILQVDQVEDITEEINQDDSAYLSIEERNQLLAFYENLSIELELFYDGQYKRRQTEEADGVGRISFSTADDDVEKFSFWLIPAKFDEDVYQIDGYLTHPPFNHLSDLNGIAPGFSYTGDITEIIEPVRKLLSSL